MAGNQLGFKDPRSTSFYHFLRIIKAMHNLTRMPLAYVVENVPGAARYRNIIDALGLPLKVQAQHLGSAARKDTVLWTNARTSNRKVFPGNEIGVSRKDVRPLRAQFKIGSLGNTYFRLFQIWCFLRNTYLFLSKNN